MQIEARKKSTGVVVPVSTDNNGNVIVSSGLSQAAIEGRLFYGATQGEVACSTTLNTTFTGLALGNPNGSGKYYVLWEFSYSHTAAIADETNLALAVGDIKGLANADPTAVKSALVGGPVTSEALLDEAATITAPTVAKQITSLDDMVAGVQWASAPQVVNLNGTIVLAPGGAVFTDSTYAIGAVMHFSYTWEEIDI